MLILVLTLAACVNNNGDQGGNNDGGNNDGGDGGEHVCDFQITESKPATCEADGYEKLACSCGETKENTLTALGHDIQPNGGMAASCTRKGVEYNKCTRCNKSENKMIPALGHEFGQPTEASRFAYCSREGCTMSEPAFPKSGQHSESLKFVFGESHKTALSDKHDEVVALLEAADAYDPALHGYAESGELYDLYSVVEDAYEEYTDMVYFAMDQYSIAMTLYYCNYNVPSYETAYNEMADYYTGLVSKYYSLSQPWYDSMYREFFFYGATEEEINAFLFDSNALANPEYSALKERNTAIELEFNNIEDPINSDLVPVLYAEMVENNNRMAVILGYDNYLEYAYADVYDREYTYEDVAKFTEFVKEYIAPIYSRVAYDYSILMSNGGDYTQKDIDGFYGLALYSFFTNELSNVVFNDFIDEMNMGFTSNPDKQFSFSDVLNALCADGNLFRGSYEGAYVTYLYDNELPIAYFGGNGYDTPLTVSHEFGHYMNEIYNRSEYDQSYDLLESHSQGHEMLFIHFAKGYVTPMAYKLAETYELYSMLGAVIRGLRIDCFERAIYLNEYNGTRSNVIMADGKISPDEYDLLYASIGEDFGLVDSADDLEYWRYGMTITSPCYYVSYSISAINALQIYAKIDNESFDAAKESYLKLITYTDVDPEMGFEDVILYAGLTSYNDEQTYKTISDFFNRRWGE